MSINRISKKYFNKKNFQNNFIPFTKNVNNSSMRTTISYVKYKLEETAYLTSNFKCIISFRYKTHLFQWHFER